MAGSTAKEMRDQVGDLMEKKLQELPFLDKIDTYTKPGFLAMSVTFKDTTPPSQVPALSINCARNWATFTTICLQESKARR